jgi:hypothetical protein
MCAISCRLFALLTLLVAARPDHLQALPRWPQAGLPKGQLICW